MKFEELKELIKTDFEKALIVLMAKQKSGISDFKKEYDGARDLRAQQVGLRRDKSVGKDKKTVSVTKIPIDYQKKIVLSAVSFLLGSPVNITSEQSDALDLIKGVWNANRLDNLLKKACEIAKSETEAIIFFFFEKGLNNDGKEETLLKIRLHSSENGTYSPYFDEFGGMKAFTWQFETLDSEGKKIQNVWVFTEESTFIYIKSDGWNLEETKPNLLKKIPVVYISEKEPEWKRVEGLIDRNEMTLSKFVDTNDYFSAPIVKLYGTVKSLPNKEDNGKAIRIPQKYQDGKLVASGDAKYLTWEHAPNAIKLENEITENHIHSITDTPDLSFNNVKGLGSTSGVALKLMFMGPTMKAKWAEGDYSVAISRIINLIQAGISNVTSIKDKGKFKDFTYNIKFTSILPENLLETITTLSEAVGGKPIMSQETAMKHNPLVANTDDEKGKIKEESKISLGDTIE